MKEMAQDTARFWLEKAQLRRESAALAWPRAQGLWADWAPEAPLVPGWWQGVLAADPALAEAQVLWAFQGEAALGFALVKPSELNPKVGHVELLAVAPEARGQGLGQALGEAALASLQGLGCTQARWGAGLHHAFPGAPAHLPGAWPLARALGYQAGREVWDVRGPSAQAAPLWPEGWSSRPFEAQEGPLLVAFLAAHFPGRWHRDVALALAQGRPPSDWVGLWSPAGEVQGFAWSHPPDAPGASRWQGLAPGAGAVGPLGLAEGARGGGKGLALVAQALRHLQGQGVAEVVIDWTDLVDFYARLGFKPWLSYLQAERSVGPEGGPL